MSGRIDPGPALEAALSAAQGVSTLQNGPSFHKEPWAAPAIAAACMAFLSRLDREEMADMFREEGWVKRGSFPMLFASTTDYFLPIATDDLGKVFDAARPEDVAA